MQQCYLKNFSIILDIFNFITSLSFNDSGCFSFKCLNANLTLSPHSLHFVWPNKICHSIYYLQTNCKVFLLLYNNVVKCYKKIFQIKYSNMITQELWSSKNILR